MKQGIICAQTTECRVTCQCNHDRKRYIARYEACIYVQNSMDEFEPSIDG